MKGQVPMQLIAPREEDVPFLETWEHGHCQRCGDPIRFPRVEKSLFAVHVCPVCLCLPCT